MNGSVLQIEASTLCKKLAGISLMLAIFFMMFSVQIMNKFLIMSIFFVVIDKTNWTCLPLILSNSVVKMSLLLVILFTIGVFYSEGSFYEAYRVWDKYLKILYLTIFLPLFFDVQFKKNLLTVLLISVVLNEIITYLHYFNYVSFHVENSKHWLFVQDIDASFILSFVCFVLLNLCLDERKYCILYFIAFMVCFFDLFFMNQERTGYIIFLGLSVLMLWQRLGMKGIYVSIVVIPILTLGIYEFSSPFNLRIKQITSDIQSYQEGKPTTSIGYRLTFATYSFSIIKLHPFLGAGTGSFIKLYREMKGPMLPENTTPGHPHNEYIFIFLQLGILGLMTFVCWLYVQYRKLACLSINDQRLAKGLLLGFIILGFCNCSLYVSPAGILFIVLMSAFLAGQYKNHVIVNKATLEWR